MCGNARCLAGVVRRSFNWQWHATLLGQHLSNFKHVTGMHAHVFANVHSSLRLTRKQASKHTSIVCRQVKVLAVLKRVLIAPDQSLLLYNRLVASVSGCSSA